MPNQTLPNPPAGFSYDDASSPVAAPAAAPPTPAAPALPPPPAGFSYQDASGGDQPSSVLKRNTGYSWSDPLKQVGVGALQGVGSLVSGIGSFGQMVARPIVAGVNAVAGQPVLQRPVNAFKPAGDWISGVGSKLEGTESQAAQQANAQPVVTGNVLSPSSWRLGAGASHPASWVQGAANLVGQALPMLAGGVEAKGLNLAPELVSKIASGEALTAAETAAVNTAAKVAARRTLGTGAAIGGLQGAQGSADSEQQRIMAMTPAQLAQLPGYQSRISQGMSPQDAQSDLAQATAANTFAATLPISTAAGAASALPFVHGAQEALTKAAGRSVLKRIGAGAAIEAPVQGAIGAGQQMAQNAASNATTGAQTPITDNTLAAFGGGALAGGLFGAAGAVLHRGLPGSLTDAADTIHAAETVAPGSTVAGAGAPAGAPVSPENASATATPAQSGQSTARVDPGQPPWDANDIGDAGQPSRDTLVSALASHMLAQHAATGDMRIDTQAIAKAWGVPQSQVVQARSRADRLANEMYADQVKAKVAASLQAKADAERDEALSAANEDSNSSSAAPAADAATPIVQSDTAANSDTSASESTQTPLKPGQPLHPWTPIDDSVSVPYAGGVSDNGQTIYLDKRMPKTVDVDGTPVDAQQAVALHERTEWPLMHLSGPMSDGDLNDLAQRVGLKSADELPPQVRSDLAAGKSLDYAPAHELATQAENQWVRTQYGVDPAKYQSALTDAIGKARTEAPDSADVPKDLDSKPYQNEGETDLVSGEKPTLTGAETRGEDQPPPDETEKVPKTETPPTGGVSRSGEQAAARTTPARREVGTTELDRREIPQHNAMRPAEALSHTLYRDTGAESAVEMLDGMPSHSGPGVHSVFAASHEHLAKGQGGNHGVMLKLDPHGFDGRFNLNKPAARELIQRNGEAEIEITPKTGAKSGNAVLSVTLHKGWKKGQSKGYVNRLLMNLREREQNGWTRVDTPEGIEFHAPGVESGADRRAQEAGPPKKSEPPAQADQTPPKGGVSASGKSKEPSQKPSPHVETARKLLGADVGDTVRTTSIGHDTQPGSLFHIDAIDRNGTVHTSSPGGGSGTFTRDELRREVRKGQTFEKVSGKPAAETTQRVETAATAAASHPANDRPEPTDAQKEAGNYAKGHVSLQGLDISIENPRGSERSGKRPDGSTWSHTMSDHYGYIRRTEGADGEHVDVYIGPKPESKRVYVVDQIDQQTGKFDEHKVMLGFTDRGAAERAYKSNFDKGWKMGHVRGMSMDDFKTWLKEGDTAKPVHQATAVADEAHQATSASNTKDAGEELWANRRNSTGKGIQWHDIAELNDTLKAREAVKSKVWPRPNYAELVDGGMPAPIAHVIKQVYDAISVKPHTSVPTDQHYQDYIGAVQKIRDAAFAWAKHVMEDGGTLDEKTRADIQGIADKSGMDPKHAAAIVSALKLATKREYPILDAVMPMPAMEDGRNVSRFRTGEQGKANNALAHLLGGNKLAAALQINADSLRDADKATGKGWPASKEAWEKTFTIHESKAGEKVYRGGKTEILTEPEFWVSRRNGSRYRSIVADGFKTREDAVAAAKDAYAKTRQSGGDGAKAEVPVELQDARKGVPRRAANEDVDSEKLRDTFGFKGINFGNWMKGDGAKNIAERQAHLNHAYDAFHDLADVMGLPPKAMSLDGTLGLAVGAQGKGGKNAAAAHFIPGVNEINLTREQGAGSLAHEWAHALDHYFATQVGGRIAASSHPFLSEHLNDANDGVRPEIRRAFKTIVDNMTTRPETDQEMADRLSRYQNRGRDGVEQVLKQARAQIEDSAKGDKAAALEQFDDLAKRLRTGDVGEGYVKTGKGRLDSAPQVVGQVANLVKEATGRKPDWTEALGSYARMVNSAKAAKSDNADRAMRVKSDYAKEARKLEGSRKTAYWSSHLEMFARAFQSYVLDKLADEGAQNHYLTRPQMTPEQRAALLADPMGKMLVEAGDRYPRGAERAAINKAFDTLVGDLKTETSENGNVRLFSLDDQGDPVTGRQARTFEEARKAADDFVGKPIKNDHGLVPATVSKTTLAKMLSNSATQKSSSPADHLRAVANVDALYRNGMLDETGKDKRGEPTIAAIHRVVAPMVGVNGDVVAVKMTVKETTHPDSPNPLYTVETLETEKPALYAPRGEVEPAPGQNRNAGQAGFSPEVTRMLEDFKNRLTAGKQDFDMRGARATTSADRGNPAEAAHTARVQSVVDQLTSQWRGSDLPRVHVRDTAEALPEDMKRNAAGEPDNAYKRARGAYDGKNIWIVAAKHDDTAEGRAQLASTLAHEAIGHYGIDRVVTRELGEGAWKHITDNITRIEREKTGGKDIQSVLADVRRRYGASANATTMARETLAVMAERGMRNGLLDRAVAAVRAFLRRIMPSMSLKDIDLRRLLAKSSDYLERGETPREKVQSRAAMAFSRDGWREDFPNVVTAHQPGFVREHADYTAAKAGDAVAAARLARDAVTPEFVAKVRNSLPDDAHDLVVVPVHARESTGDNKIPAAAADVLARKLGADVNDHIVQAEKVGRGTGDAVHRLANQPTFTGDVQPGRDYVLLDDTLTQGGTLAQLKTHIEREGGRVVLATALTGKDYSRKLSLDPDTLGNVRDRFGRIEGWWKRRFGYGFEGLTESEARAMLTLDHGKLSPDQLRDRIIARGIPELSHVDEGPAGARPGTEATGTAGRLTDTDSFRQFFGDSKVVDETGEPLTVYHGTADDFSTFDKSKGMEATGHATAPLGHFFTPDRALAERYAENASDGRPADQRLIDAHLRIEKPYEMSLKEAQAIRTPEQAEALRTKLQHEGYDGIHIPESKTWVAFDSRQVKSASENHGTFDPANPNIYYSLDDSGQKDEGEAQRRPFGRAAESVEALHQQLPKLDRSVFQHVKDWVAGKARDLEPYALGWLQLRHLLELAGEEKVLASPSKAYADTFQRLDGDRNRMTEVGAGKVQELQKWAYVRGPAGWRGKMKPEAQRLFKFMHEVTQIAVDPTNAYERLLMRDSTGEQMPWTEDLRKERIQALKDQMRGRSGDDKTAMEDEINDLKALPGRERARQEKYPELVAQWNSFSDEAKQQFNTMRDHYREMSDQLQEATLARIDALDIPKQNKLAIKALITKNFEDAQVGGVYFPLMRFGNYWIAGHRSDGEYVFAKYENAAAAADAEKRMLAGGYSIEAKGRQDADYKAKQAPSGTFIHALMDTLRKAGAPEKTQDDIYQMYLKTLPELSMRKRGIHRKNIAGYTDNVPRAFASSVFHGAHQVSKARYGYQLQGLMDHMTELLDARRTTMSVPEAAHADALLGELRKRNDWIMNPSNSRLATMLTSIGFAYHLSASPAAAIVNLLQVPQIVLPVLGAHHGWPTAMKVLGASMRDAIRTVGNIDRVLHGEELMAFKALREQGTFQRTATHTLAGVAEGDELKSNPAWTKLMNAVGWMFHTSEVINREGTGMAAFRLARAKGQSFEQAIRYADEITNGTHGDYSNANRARYMQGNVGKIALQFKNYSLAMSWLWGRQFYKAFKGETPEVRAAARRVLTGLTGMTGLLAGAMGLPMINALRYGAQAVHAVTGDPNEPWDFNTEFRSWLDEHLGQEAGSLVADGAASQLGANIASRVSMSDLWFRDADRQLEGADAYDNMLESLAGPLGGLIKNMYVGAQQYNEGHVWRGIETMMPTAPKNAMKAMRFASQGDNTLQGEPIVDDISTPEALIQAIGFQPTKVADQQKVNSALLNYSHFVQDRRQSLINAYALAHNAGDEEGQADALRSIRDFNQKYPEVAVRMSTIHDSLRTRARRVAQAENGVVLQRRLAGRIRQDVGAMAAPN